MRARRGGTTNPRPAPEAPAPPPPSELEALGIVEPAPQEVAKAAGYPAPPSSVFSSVPYAIQVFLRRRELLAEVRDAERLEGAARSAGEHAMATLGRELLKVADSPNLAPLAAELAAAQEAGRYADSRSEAAASENRVFEEQQKGLEAELQRAEAEVAPLRDRETRLTTVIAMKRQDLERARAKVQRIEIELRNLGKAAVPDQNKLVSLEAERKARHAEMQVLEAPVLADEGELAEVRDALGDALARISDIQSELQAQKAALRRDTKSQTGELSNLAKQHDLTLRALGEAATAQHLATLAPIDVANAASDTVRTWRARKRQHAIKTLAVDGYDHRLFRIGAGILGSAVGLIFLTLVIAIVT